MANKELKDRVKSLIDCYGYEFLRQSFELFVVYKLSPEDVKDLYNGFLSAEITTVQTKESKLKSLIDEENTNG